MFGLITRGRITWIIAVVLGAILLIIGIAANIPLLIWVGAIVLVIGAIFLILSVVTKGQTD
jgi:4-hydroxybenzoate polyprenyltransferase